MRGGTSEQFSVGMASGHAPRGSRLYSTDWVAVSVSKTVGDLSGRAGARVHAEP